MGLSERVAADFARLTGDKSAGFGIEIVMTNPANESATVVGFTTEHHYSLKFDDTGNQREVSAQKTSICFAESNLPAGYSIRNGAGDINLARYLFSFALADGVVKNYETRDWFPDSKLGGIVVILNQYSAA